MTPEEIAAAAAAEEAKKNQRSPEQIAREATAAEIRETAKALGKPELEAAFYQKRLLDETAGDPNVDEFKAFARKAIATASPSPSPMNPADQALMQGGVRTELGRSIPRHGAITAFKGDDAAKQAFRFGQWALGRALFDPNNSASVAARKYCDDHGLTRAMGEDVNDLGGYLVPTEFSNDIIDLKEMYGVARRVAGVEPMSSDTKIIPRRASGLTAYFVAEAGSITASDMGWDQVQLVAKKLAVLARFSTEVNEDSIIDFANKLANEIAYAFANKEDECFFNGDGTSTYGGIVGVRAALLGVDGTIGNIQGLQVGSGNAYSELALVDFEGVVGRLPEFADTGNARWVVSRSFYWNVMVKVMLASGGVTASEIENARNKIYMGYPVEFSQVMPKTEGNSQVAALLGDFSKGAIFGSRRDTTIALSEHSRFANDQIEIRGTERFDVNVHGVGDTTNAGPIVGLITAAS